MRDTIIRVRPGYAVAAVVALGLSLASFGCGLDKQPSPDLSGPSDQGVNVDLAALPDTVNADGVSQSVVRLVLRDNKGRPISGLAVLFSFIGDGRLAPSPDSTFVGPIQTGLVMATDQNGTANVVYIAGRALTIITVYVRPYSFDAANQFFRSVDISQR
jgi:hypothetical protein